MEAGVVLVADSEAGCAREGAATVALGAGAARPTGRSLARKEDFVLVAGVLHHAAHGGTRPARSAPRWSTSTRDWAASRLRAWPSRGVRHGHVWKARSRMRVAPGAHGVCRKNGVRAALGGVVDGHAHRALVRVRGRAGAGAGAGAQATPI